MTLRPFVDNDKQTGSDIAQLWVMANASGPCTVHVISIALNMNGCYQYSPQGVCWLIK